VIRAAVLNSIASLAIVSGCALGEPAATPRVADTTVAAPQPRRPSGCREDIPDCVAACAIRETSRTEYLDWFDQRCAAVILGRNPDRVAGTAPPRVEDLLDTR
jgi:hypothetical protein